MVNKQKPFVKLLMMLNWIETKHYSMKFFFIHYSNRLMLRAFSILFFNIYVELKNPIESAVALNNGGFVIRGVDCRTLGALGMPLPRLR